jgi:HEAT repeat protein
VDVTKKDWPKAADAPALRELLKDRSPSIRGLAAEVLATLHIPEDMEAIANLLVDEKLSLPVLVAGAESHGDR